MRISTLCIAVLALNSCKIDTTSSAMLSAEDGGCFEMERVLVALIAKHRSFFQNVDANPSAVGGFSLQQASQATPSSAPPATGFDQTFGGQLAPLVAEIEAMQAELSNCLNAKFGQTADAPATQGNQSHINYTGQQYDILNYNCHSAANVAAHDDAESVGIISCAGDAPVLGSPSHHTFNYRVEGDLIVYYNWGSTCKAPRNSIPPNINDPDHQLCAETFCGDQYNPETTAPLDLGATVEEPGPLYCSQTQRDRPSCDSCCQQRGTYWDRISDDLRPTDQTFTQFMSQCYSTCAKTFP